jgi:predicted Rossmann-fold nucleotide-binding protein
MEAANRGVIEVEGRRSQSIGLPIQLPRSQELANKHLDIKSEHRRFSSRLDEFMWLSDAVIVAPGGIGTLLELVYVWQLLQVGMIDARPVVLLGRDMWEGLLEWMRDEMQGRQLIGPNDFQWIHCADTPEDAFEFIRPVHEAYLTSLVPVSELEESVVLEESRE